jgi:hypothetical protein
VNYGALVLNNTGLGKRNKIYLREMVESAALRVGMEVRIAQQPSELLIPPLTYQRLLEQGTEERKQELAGKSGADQQVYNTRSALKRFCKMLSVELSATIGEEFVVAFTDSIRRLTSEIENYCTRKKFQTEIGWWQSFHQRLINSHPLPNDFRSAIAYLIADSGLSLSVVAKLVGVSVGTLRCWANGICTPSGHGLPVISRLESLFKLPHGVLLIKVTRSGGGAKRFRSLNLPAFLTDKKPLARRVKPHLPDNFCELPIETQKEIVGGIAVNVLKRDDEFTRRQAILTKLPYRLKEWPSRLEQEYEDYALFKMADRPPLGMKRNGQWRVTTKVMTRQFFAYLFGAVSLPSKAADVRLQGLEVPPEHLTLALITCPLVIDWYTRFHCETRNVYTEQMIQQLQSYKSMLRPITGWLRQQPQMAARLQPLTWGSVEFVSTQMIEQAHLDWDGFCDTALAYYDQLIAEVTHLVRVSRDAFGRIEGILDDDNPMKLFEVLVKGMLRDLPNKHTQPIFYHIRIRNCALVILFAVTGYRRNTVRQLTYTSDQKGHLRWEDGKYVLRVPRSLFKVEDSSYFGPKYSQNDSHIELPNVFELNEIFSEYLNESRPYLISKCHPDSGKDPLFVSSSKGKYPELSAVRMTAVFYEETGKHLAENKYRGTGIARVWRHGPHAVRHIRGTTIVKKTGSFKMAGDANQNSESTARKHYARYNTRDRNNRVNEILYDKSDKDNDEDEHNDE